MPDPETGIAVFAEGDTDRALLRALAALGLLTGIRIAEPSDRTRQGKDELAKAAAPLAGMGLHAIVVHDMDEDAAAARRAFATRLRELNPEFEEVHP